MCFAYDFEELDSVTFVLDNLPDCLGNHIAVLRTHISVVIFVNNMNNELRALRVLAERDRIHFEQINLPVDFFIVENIMTSSSSYFASRG